MKAMKVDWDKLRRDAVETEFHRCYREVDWGNAPEPKWWTAEELESPPTVTTQIKEYFNIYVPKGDR